MVLARDLVVAEVEADALIGRPTDRILAVADLERHSLARTLDYHQPAHHGVFEKILRGGRGGSLAGADDACAFILAGGRHDRRARHIALRIAAGDDCLFRIRISGDVDALGLFRILPRFVWSPYDRH